MDIFEVIKFIFGTPVISVIGVISAIAAILAITNHFFSFRDRFEKWRDKKKKEKFKKNYSVENPDFKFNLYYVSDHPIGKCILSATILNTSKEVKYIDIISYDFLVPGAENVHQTPTSFINGEKWPKRLEHGERLNVSIDFYSDIVNSLFRYWQREADVYAKCHSTTGDLLRSNTIKFDSLTKSVEPLKEEYQKLAVHLSQKFNGLQRDIEVSLWQFQLFGKLTSHIARQLQQNNIPIAQFLVNVHEFVPQQDPWYHWDRLIWEKNISLSSIEEFLERLN